MWKKAYDKVVCERGCRKVKCEKWCGERWCVWKMVWWKMVRDKVMCKGWCGERWCETKCCVKDGVRKMVCEKWCVKNRVCERWCEKNGVWKMVCEKSCMTKLCVTKMVYNKMKVDVAKCYACYAKRRWMMSPSATPATQNEGGCYQVPRLPRKVPQRYWRPNLVQARHQSQPNARPKYHAYHAKRRWMSPSITPHVKRRWMSPNVTPPTQSAATLPAINADQARHQSQPSALSATPATRNEGGCYQVPRLPHKMKVDPPSATPATQTAAASPATSSIQARHQSQPSV